MKNTLRKQALDKRKTLNCTELSKKIIKNLTSLPEYKQSKNIICYYPLKYETDITDCLEDTSKNIFLPRVNGLTLDICPCKNLKKGSFGIIEPQSVPIENFSSVDMIIVPACAVDKNGYRLGWGKGYYDRFLPCLPSYCIKVIPIYSELVYDCVYPDKYDVQSDIIVTDTCILRLNVNNT